jgi:hypothetical protein
MGPGGPEDCKKCPIFPKVAQTVAKPKMPKYLQSKLDLKVQNNYIKSLLKP